MEINAENSGIMRVLKRKGKWKGVKNVLNIPEIDCYKYLGVKLEQSLLLNGFGEEIEKKEAYIVKRVKILKPSLVSTQSKLMAFKTIWRSQISYVCSVLTSRSKKYRHTWETAMYRILKGLFNIKINISKMVLMDALGLENISKTNRDRKEEDLNIYQNKSVGRLTNKSIKFWVDALFRNFKKTSHCGWNIQVNNKHVVEDWSKLKNGERKFGIYQI